MSGIDQPSASNKHSVDESKKSLARESSKGNIMISEEQPKQQVTTVEKTRCLNDTFLSDLCFLLDSFYATFLNDKYKKNPLAANKVAISEDGKSFLVYLTQEVGGRFIPF